MSVYNTERFLKESIKSVLEQTYRDFEFIIIDDGSTDQSLKIIESFNDSRIKIICNEENQGLTKSLNKGIAISKGFYIIRHDGDDISLPYRFERMVEFMDHHPDVALLGGAFIMIDENGRDLQTVTLEDQEDKIQQELLHGNEFGSEIFKKEILKKIGGYREEFLYAQDYDLCLRISEKYKVANLTEPLYKYRICSTSISVKKRILQYRYGQLAIDLAKERRDFGKDKLMTLKEEGGGKFINAYFTNIDNAKSEMLSYHALAKRFYHIEKYSISLRFLFKSIYKNISFTKNWILLIKILIKILSNLLHKRKH